MLCNCNCGCNKDACISSSGESACIPTYPLSPYTPTHAKDSRPETPAEAGDNLLDGGQLEGMGAKGYGLGRGSGSVGKLQCSV